MLTEKPEARTNVPSERDMERDYELEQWIEMATLFRQCDDIESPDRDE